jgi:hypothetical protein
MWQEFFLLSPGTMHCKSPGLSFLSELLPVTPMMSYRQLQRVLFLIIFERVITYQLAFQIRVYSAPCVRAAKDSELKTLK